MAAPIQLKANKPGGMTHAYSRRSQKTFDGKVERQATKETVRKYSGKAQITKPAYAGVKAPVRPKVSGVNSRKTDYASAWMQTHGLKNAQNFGSVPRVPFASVPADGIGAGSNTRRTRSQVSYQPVPAKRVTRKSSSGPTNSRVKMTVTGRNYQNTRRPRVQSASRPTTRGR